MRRLFLVTIACLLLGARSAAADGCPPQSCGISGSQDPASGLLLVRPNGQLGPLVGYDGRTGRERFRLPRGLLAGQRFFTTRRAGEATVVEAHRLAAGGRVVRSWRFPRQAWLGAASPTQLVVQLRGDRHTTRFAVGSRRVELHGSYEAEALSPNGRLLFLIHWRNDGYDLQTYDFAKRTLRPTTLAEPDEKMTGTAWSAVTTRDGGWLLTLYVGGGEHGAFVHALDLRSGVAHCVDLPWLVDDVNRAGSTALALSPDEHRLYLANSALGRVTVVSLKTLRVTRDVHFASTAPRSIVYGINPSAAISPRGRVLAFAFQRSMWLYDTAYGRVRGPFEAAAAAAARSTLETNVVGLAFAPEGRRVLALRTDRQSVIYDGATGVALRRPRLGEKFTIRFGTGEVAGYTSRAGQRFFLPQGRPSADGTAYFTSYPRARGSTRVEQFDPTTGRLVDTRTVPGRWRLGAVSAHGSTLALAHHERGTTYLQLLDARTYRPVHARTLPGVYTLDAVTDDARRVYLIQHYRSGRYAVRALDFAQNRLWTATLREKGEKERPAMTGIAASQVASPDGEWLLTLYVNTKDGKAFVHALNLERGSAACIDLPSRANSLRALRDYALALAPDGGVYAASGALGVVARIDLRRERLTRATRFPGTGRSGGWASSALAHDGATLWFSSGRNVWRYDVAAARVAGPRAASAPVLGLALSRDGRRLFAARADGAVRVFDAARAWAVA